MKAQTKVTFVDDTGEKFFGEGPARLLRGIEATGSLRSSALAMNMAYSKAIKILKNAESALGYPLTARTAGGISGGGSTLTPEGEDWLMRYEAYAKACTEANNRLFRSFFPKVGCVIMASGMGKRFGSNKLMADFGGQPMVLRALEATEGLKSHRVVVTCHKDVAALCRSKDVPVILHSLPLRSDTVRLGMEAMTDTDGCLFIPGDQPLLRRETVDALVRIWTGHQEYIYRPACQEVPGSPVLFPRWAYPELLSLPQGKGGSYLAARYPEKVRLMAVEDPFQLMDADTPETLSKLLSQLEDPKHTNAGQQDPFCK